MRYDKSNRTAPSIAWRASRVPIVCGTAREVKYVLKRLSNHKQTGKPSAIHVKHVMNGEMTP